MKITIIAAHDLNYGIGYQNQLPWRLSADLAFFKAQTLGKTILMGRKTYESIGKPLPGRRNLVLTTQNIAMPGLEFISNLNQLGSFNLEELMIIGGCSLYQYFLEIADEMLITEVEAKCQVDTYFPKYNKEIFKEKVLDSHPVDEKNQYAMLFKQYIRI